MPQPRNDLTNDVNGEEDDLATSVIRELGGGRCEPRAPPSPVAVAHTKEKPIKWKLVQQGEMLSAETPTKRIKDTEVVDGGEDEVEGGLSCKRKLNSKIFPVEKRPSMFQDDEKFNLLKRDWAAKVCYQHSVELESPYASE